MKKFRRIIAILCLIVILVTLLTGCKYGKCEECGKKTTLKKFTYNGESAWLCSDCYDQAEALVKLIDAFK